MDSQETGLDIEFWLRHVRFGVRVSLGLIALTGPYLLLTDSGDARPWLLAVIVATSLFTLVVNRLPWSRILEHPRRMWFFYVWSSVATSAITLAAAADGGINSPLLLYYALPMLYAAIAYPTRAVFTLSAVMIVPVGIMAFATEVTDPGRVWLTLAILALSSWTFTYASGNYRQSVERAESLAAQLRDQANRDALTGCMNHRAFMERLSIEVARAQRSGRPLTLVMGDLDHFKAVNDVEGHRVGDAVLKQVGANVLGFLRTGDEVARIGGEEFAILLPETDLDHGSQIAERLRTLVGASEDPVRVTMSFGVATLPAMAETAERLLEVADLGLYAAKSNGRDCVAVHRQAPGPTPRSSATMENRVSRLLAGDDLHAHYQPIVSLSTGEVVAYEALARIRDSRLRPDQWLELAEQTGQRVELEGAMLDAAFDGWPGVPDVLLFVNLSPDALAAGLAWARLDRMGDHVVIEVSEHDPVTNYRSLRATLDDLAEHGIGLAVDDVGAGHANMRHVLELHPQFVKLDRSLVSNVDRTELQASLIRSMAAFTHDGDMQVIGEGIERLEEAEALRAAGVALGQGYLLARPGPPLPKVDWPLDHHGQERPASVSP